ncbi:MAG TPA: MXAN_6640 family putative metalloprotease, partial [Bacteroidota bacterium]|nr:MXAN_6640 family putative metalloprotease [Bacteroidota bacterium]
MRINRVLLLLSTALLSLQPAFAGGFSPQTWGALRPERPSSFALINHALADGSLSRDEWALLQAYALLAHDRLPLPYLMGGKEKCGTWVLAEISRHWASLSENTRRSMMSLGFTPQGTLARPPGLDSTRSSAHFVIHYSTAPGDRNAVPPTDADGNGTPDYIDTVLSVMEYVWSVEIGNLGYTAPPPDGSAGGDNRYDVYIFDLEPDLYGYNQEDVRIGDNPNSGSVVETNAYTSYLVLRNNYSGFGAPGETPVEALKVTAAHEFYHGVQAGYDGNEADWLAEATATWCEGQVYGSIKENYAYLPSWFAHPEYPLDASDYTADTLLYGFDHWYGSWIFFEDISENTAGGTTTVRQVLERTLAYDNIHADYSFQEVGDALASSGSTFGIVFHDFTAANASLIDPPLRYRDGGNYPPIGRTVITHDTTIGGTLPRRASSYYQIAPSMLPDCTQLLTVSFTSNDPVASQSIQLVVFAGGGGYSSEQQFPATITLSPTAIPDSIFIIVLSQGGTVSSGSYTLSISSQPRPGAYMITDLGVLPAPGSTVGGLNNRGSVVLNVQTYSPGSQDNSVW